jgi:hypothetical protein
MNDQNQIPLFIDSTDHTKVESSNNTTLGSSSGTYANVILPLALPYNLYVCSS